MLPNFQYQTILSQPVTISRVVMLESAGVCRMPLIQACFEEAESPPSWLQSG